MPHGRVLQHDPQLVRADQARWSTSDQGGGDAKLGRSPGWNLLRDERFRLCVYAFVEPERIDKGSDSQICLIFNTCDLDNDRLRNILSVKRVDERLRSPVKMELDPALGRSRGY